MISNIRWDFLNIYDGNGTIKVGKAPAWSNHTGVLLDGTGPHRANLTGQAPKDRITSHGSDLFIQFDSDKRPQLGMGFKIQYFVGEQTHRVLMLK